VSDTTEPLTDAEIAELRRIHQPRTITRTRSTIDGPMACVLCRFCRHAPPCPTIRALDELIATRAELRRLEGVVAEAVAAMRESDNNPEMYTAMDAAIYGRTLWVSAEKADVIRVHDALLALVATASTEQEKR
jgi:hypothetical protein